jgi:phage FluMu gp28-like protein
MPTRSKTCASASSTKSAITSLPPRTRPARWNTCAPCWTTPTCSIATRYIVSRGEESEQISGTLANGVKFTQEIKFNYMRFENGSRIMAFSSNPYAMAVFGGDVGLDEFAKHPNAEKLWETAQGRITWGFDLGMWSAHDGTDTLFYQFAQEARGGQGGWSYYRVTMEDAVALGLVEKINSVRGTRTTRAEFIQDCKTARPAARNLRASLQLQPLRQLIVHCALEPD